MQECKPADRNTRSNSPATFPWLKTTMFLIVIAVFCYLFVEHREKLDLKYLAEQESSFLDFKEVHPVAVYAVAFLVYAVMTGLSIPGAAILTLVYGSYFDFVPAFILVSFASTTGATLAFLLSRYFFRDTIQHKFGDRLEIFNESLSKEGAFYLFTLRLIPAVPFFVINVVMGLTPIRVWTYWWVSQLGMLAGTCVYVYAGNQFPTLQELSDNGASGILNIQIVVAFVVLGFFPLVVKKIMARVRPKKDLTNE